MSRRAERVAVTVAGARGRMGQRCLRLLAQDERLELAAALDRKAGKGELGVTVTDDAAAAVRAARVVIDFTAPAAVTTLAPLCAKAGAAYLVASTALDAAAERALVAAARKVPVLQAPNLSLGVNVLLEAVELVASRLGAGFDVEIAEIHHRHKTDAPSGTALALGAAVRRGRPDLRDQTSRAGQRQARELGYAALRGGDVSGEHTIFFFGEGERVELTHRASTADIFARGALAAAAWLAQRAPGRYAMRDVLRP